MNLDTLIQQYVVFWKLVKFCVYDLSLNISVYSGSNENSTTCLHDILKYVLRLPYFFYIILIL